jgi:RNA polymerase sigma-70 factor (ECF subfamily)
MTPLRAGLSVWPQLEGEVSEAEFSGFLARRAPMEPVPFADLLLACGGVLGRPRALALLEQTLFSAVPGWVARVDASPDFGAEVAQAVRELLLSGARPRLDEYAGKGSLEGWVRVTAVRVALRKQKPGRGAQAEVSLERLEAPTAGPELDLARAQGRQQVVQALDVALAGLDAEARAWLKLRYLDGLSLERIAGLFGVHTSTVSRRLTSLEGQVLAAVRQHLQASLRLPGGEVDSLIRFVQSQLSASFEQALRSHGDGGP